MRWYVLFHSWLFNSNTNASKAIADKAVTAIIEGIQRDVDDSVFSSDSSVAEHNPRLWSLDSELYGSSPQRSAGISSAPSSLYAMEFGVKSTTSSIALSPSVGHSLSQNQLGGSPALSTIISQASSPIVGVRSTHTSSSEPSIYSQPSDLLSVQSRVSSVTSVASVSSVNYSGSPQHSPSPRHGSGSQLA